MRPSVMKTYELTILTKCYEILSYFWPKFRLIINMQSRLKVWGNNNYMLNQLF